MWISFCSETDKNEIKIFHSFILYVVFAVVNGDSCGVWYIVCLFYPLNLRTIGYNYTKKKKKILFYSIDVNYIVMTTTLENDIVNVLSHYSMFKPNFVLDTQGHIWFTKPKIFTVNVLLLSY